MGDARLQLDRSRNTFPIDNVGSIRLRPDEAYGLRSKGKCSRADAGAVMSALGRGCVKTREHSVFRSTETIPEVSIVDPDAI